MYETRILPPSIASKWRGLRGLGARTHREGRRGVALVALLDPAVAVAPVAVDLVGVVALLVVKRLPVTAHGPRSSTESR